MDDPRLIVMYFLILTGVMAGVIRIIGWIYDWWHERQAPRTKDQGPRPHIGFCMGEFNMDDCYDCPTLKECLELRDRERGEYPIDINEPKTWPAKFC